MSTKRLISLVVLTDVVALALIAAIFWGSAQSAAPASAQTIQPGDGDPDRDPQPGSYVVPDMLNSTYMTFAGYTFVPRPPIPGGTPTQLVYQSGGGVYISNGQNDPLVANLELPNGAILTEFRLYYYDTSDSRDVRAELRRTNFLGAVDELASVSSSGAPGFQSVATSNIQNNTVNNASYAYTANVYLNPGANPDRLRLYGIRVAYTFANANFLPTVQK